MDTPTLFDAPAPMARATDPETSREAARITEPRAGTDRALALLGLDTLHRATDFELAAHVNRAQTSIGVRRKELVSLGYAERAPVKPRNAPSGAPSIVWQITAKGREKARGLREDDPCR